MSHLLEIKLGLIQKKAANWIPPPPPPLKAWSVVNIDIPNSSMYAQV